MIERESRPFKHPRLLAMSQRRVENRTEIWDQVVEVLDSDREPQQVVGDSRNRQTEQLRRRFVFERVARRTASISLISTNVMGTP